MQNSLLKTLLILSFAFGLFSCKKETDTDGPQVSFVSPFDAQSFMVYGNVPVKADIKDATKITNVVVSLVDANHIPVQNSVSVPVSSPSMSVDISYAIDNIHLESGLYAILITASDGKNDTHAYQPIYITAVPKVLKKIFVATGMSSSQTDMYCIDSSFSALNFYHSFSGDFLGTSVSSYFQQVYLCGNYTGNFTGMSLKDNSVVFSIPAFATGTPYFTSYYSEDKYNYVSKYDETVKGYNNTGMGMYNGTANGGHYICKTGMNNGCLIAEEKSKTGGSNILVAFYKTGTPEKQVSISQNVVAFCEKDDEDVFVFGNLAGQGIIQLYDRLHNNLWNPYPYSLSVGTILSAVKIDDDTYLIGHSDGTIYKYQYMSSSVTPYLAGYTAVQLKYDALNRNVYVVEQNRITAIDFASRSVVNTINSAQNIYDIGLLYNR